MSKNEFIDRKKIAVITQIPPEEVKQILLSCGRPDATNGWALLQPPDTTFEEKYQELKERQEVYWRAKEVKFQEMEIERGPPKRTRKRSIREASGSAANVGSSVIPIKKESIH